VKVIQSIKIQTLIKSFRELSANTPKQINLKGQLYYYLVGLI